MKRILAIIMVLAVSLSLFACGKVDGTESTGSSTGSSAGSSAGAADKTDEQTSDPTAAEEIKKGVKGSGPVDIDAVFITLKLPAGYRYEVDSFSKDPSNPLKGDVTLFIYKEGEYSSVATLTATARNMVDSQEKAVENTIKLCNLQTYKDGKSKIGKDVKYGENTYSPIHVTTEYYEKDFFVTYANRGAEDKTGLLVKLETKSDKIKADDPFTKELLDSLKIVMA